MTPEPAIDLPAETPGSRAMFLAFLRVGVSGFGGVMPFAHRMLVERERWLSEKEFLDVLSLCQFLPGPNIVNMSIVLGRRFDGARGAVAAFTGLILMPMAIIIALGLLYGAFGQMPHVREAFGGIASAAAGLVIAMAVRMARPLRGSRWQLALVVLAFVVIGLLRSPLAWALLGLVPLALLCAWKEQQP